MGASAGGLEAMSSLFGAAPDRCGIAFVVIQHLDPTHPSTLHELLKRYTKMTVLEAKNGVKVEPDHVYIIPPMLSGTGSDGAAGAKAIKAELGTVLAQDPSAARYDGMPRAARPGDDDSSRIADNGNCAGYFPATKVRND